MALKDEVKGIIGHREGGDPEDERENFYICAACKQAVDMRDLGQIFHHEEADHKPLELNS